MRTRTRGAARSTCRSSGAAKGEGGSETTCPSYQLTTTTGIRARVPTVRPIRSPCFDLSGIEPRIKRSRMFVAGQRRAESQRHGTPFECRAEQYFRSRLGLRLPAFLLWLYNARLTFPSFKSDPYLVSFFLPPSLLEEGSSLLRARDKPKPSPAKQQREKGEKRSCVPDRSSRRRRAPARACA